MQNLIQEFPGVLGHLRDMPQSGLVVVGNMSRYLQQIDGSLVLKDFLPAAVDHEDSVEGGAYLGLQERGFPAELLSDSSRFATSRVTP